MNCKKIEHHLGMISGLAEDAYKALCNGNSTAVETNLRYIEDLISQIREEQSTLRRQITTRGEQAAARQAARDGEALIGNAREMRPKV